MVGSEALGLGGARWLGALDVAVVPLVAQLAGALAARSRPDPGIERTLRAAVLLLCKALLQAHNLATLICRRCSCICPACQQQGVCLACVLLVMSLSACMWRYPNERHLTH